MKRVHSNEFKTKVALEAIKGIDTIASIAQKHGLHPGQINQWKAHVLSVLPDTFGTAKKSKTEEGAERDILEQKIGQLVIENDFLKKKWESSNLKRGAK